LTALKQNPSLVKESRDLGKVAAKVAKEVAAKATDKVAVGGAPKPSAPHAKPSTKPTSTKPQITNPRKPSSSRCKRPLDTACQKPDSLVPAAVQTTPQPPESAPKKPRLSTQVAPRAPLAGEVQKRVTRSVAKAGEEQPTYNPPQPHPSTPVFRKGQRGNVLRDFKPKVIHGRKYSGHALHRMSERGLTPSAIENAIKNGITNTNKISGRLEHFDEINKITVITCGKTGRIITLRFGN